MRQSKLFTKTQKEVPSDEVSKNAQLLIRAGFVYKEMAGVYAFLPLGLRVLEKIKNIVRDEMNKIGGQEMVMTSLQRKELWEVTDRWDNKNVDIWFKTALQNGNELGLAWSHEEPISDMMKNYIASYKDLPVFAYQFQIKLRNELRSKSGIMRGREFLMKDLYSYTVDEKAHDVFYNQVIDAYHAVFKRVGLGEITHLTFASGGAFTEFSHEFQTVTDAGEDTIYLDKKKMIAVNDEIMNEEVLKNLGLERENLEELKTSEVGNIFNFGTVKSEQLGLNFANENGDSIPVYLGSYGIGITRLMGVIVENFSDDKGIIWPEQLAPFAAHLLVLGKEDSVKKEADDLYEQLVDKGVEVLYDDREASPGEKFADSDLIGIPMRIVVSKKTLEKGELEIKKRATGEVTFLSKKDFLKKF